MFALFCSIQQYIIQKLSLTCSLLVCPQIYNFAGILDVLSIVNILTDFDVSDQIDQ